MLPTWLSPTQIRLLPIGEEHLEFTNNLADKIGSNNIRVDIDDTNERVGKKIRNASKEWIPYIIVIGDNEVQSNSLNVTIRETGEKVDMSVDELINEVLDKNSGMPFRKLPLARNISKRINFK